MYGNKEKRDSPLSAQDVKVLIGISQEEIIIKIRRRKKMEKKQWFNFMATNNWVVFMNIMRILSFIAIAFVIYYLIKEIEAVKLLAYDPCKICISKTGCSCFCSGG